ncbi:MAG TPA: hypothetical protein VKV18_11945 [Chthonomonas sp.]|uniref:hypothetical protein n=1 Tax=Chthonomonas sp. TaxID=2282153 RepID=UPI002B4ACFFB|nr:hypothetical protein [Chthonomonas sp.]HLI49385.1 hypothetical protein [Chthonomonas sp.]
MLGIINSPELNPERQTDPQTLVGSQVAGREFVRHLIRWWPEEVAISVPSTQMAGFQRELTRYRENLGMKLKIAYVAINKDQNNHEQRW